MQTVGGLVRTKRRALNLSQRELGKMLGMHYTHLARIESGQRFPLRFIPQTAIFLEMSQADFRRILLDEKLIEQVEGPSLSQTKIESTANEDRIKVLSALGRNYFRFPTDRDRIPQLLC